MLLNTEIDNNGIFNINKENSKIVNKSDQVCSNNSNNDINKYSMYFKEETKFIINEDLLNSLKILNEYFNNNDLDIESVRSKINNIDKEYFKSFNNIDNKIEEIDKMLESKIIKEQIKACKDLSTTALKKDLLKIKELKSQYDDNFLNYKEYVYSINVIDSLTTKYIEPIKTLYSIAYSKTSLLIRLLKFISNHFYYTSIKNENGGNSIDLKEINNYISETLATNNISKLNELTQIIDNIDNK